MMSVQDLTHELVARADPTKQRGTVNAQFRCELEHIDAFARKQAAARQRVWAGRVGAVHPHCDTRHHECNVSETVAAGKVTNARRGW